MPLSALFRWFVYNLTPFDNASGNVTDGSKKSASASGRRPKPLIFMNEKDWKKDGLNPPVFPLAGLMLLIRSHPVRPTERPPGAPPTVCTPCARHVDAWVRLFAWVNAWWSRVRVGERVVVSCSRG